MRSTVAALSALAVLAAALLTGYLAPPAKASTGPIPLNCNRACLENLVDQYLTAVVAHDPKRLPLSADVRYTENDQSMDRLQPPLQHPRHGSIPNRRWKNPESRNDRPLVPRTT